SNRNLSGLCFFAPIGALRLCEQYRSVDLNDTRLLGEHPSIAPTVGPWPAPTMISAVPRCCWGMNSSGIDSESLSGTLTAGMDLHSKVSADGLSALPVRPGRAAGWLDERRPY
ncbi:hypothetical protein K0U83_10230, partial [bacterium]|nr:hypothetical protein [bacterium]